MIIARNSNDPIFFTGYGHRVLLTRESEDLSLNGIRQYIRSVRNTFSVDQCVIAPTTEALNRFVQGERAALEEMNVTIPLVGADIYAAVSDKKKFSDLCRENEISIPAEYNSITEAVLPVVAKPRKYFAGNGSVFAPFLIFNDEQRKSFLTNCDPHDFYFQEYVTGRSLYLLYYFHRNGQVYKFSQENLVQQPGGKSIIAAVSSDFHETDESLVFERLFRIMGFYGLVMVELKVGDERSWMIEANPRFWGPSQLFVDAGVNFFDFFLHDYGFIDEMPLLTRPEKAKYFWFGGVHETFRKNKELFFHNGCGQDFSWNWILGFIMIFSNDQIL